MPRWAALNRFVIHPVAERTAKVAAAKPRDLYTGPLSHPTKGIKWERILTPHERDLVRSFSHRRRDLTPESDE
jgi:hypothetical protein